MEDQAAGFPWWSLGLIIGTTAFVSWGVVETIKKTALARYRAAGHEDGENKLWWTSLLGLLSMAVGAGMGAALGMIDWTAGYGAAVGAAVGAQPVWIVKLLKKKAPEAADKVIARIGPASTSPAEDEES